MDELPPQARALLEAARHFDDPTPEDRARADAAMRDALARHDAFGDGASTVGAGRLSIKVLLGAGALLAAALLSFSALQRRSAPAEESVPMEQRVPVVSPAQLAIDPARHARTSAEAEGDSDGALGRGQGSHAGARGAVDAPLDSALAEEMALIAKTNRSIHVGRFGEARSLLQKYDRRFPRGVLREERSALGVLVQCALEPGAHAQREAERFLRSAPGSLMAARVRARCSWPVQHPP